MPVRQPVGPLPTKVFTTPGSRSCATTCVSGFAPSKRSNRLAGPAGACSSWPAPNTRSTNVPPCAGEGELDVVAGEEERAGRAHGAEQHRRVALRGGAHERHGPLAHGDR